MKITKLPNGRASCEFTDGEKHWYLNMNLVIFHREDGPAWEGNDGSKEWWINGECLPCTTQKQFERLMRLKAFW
jgi:hypothetical protein